MNDVLVTIEQRYDRTSDGKVWAPMFDYCFWKRYLEVFDHVRVLARVRDVASVPSDWLRADGENVSFVAVPYYVGPVQYLRNAVRVNRAVRGAVKAGEAIVLRIDSQIAACLYPVLKRTGQPYGVEVVVDPYDVFAPGAITHPLRAFFRWKFTYQMRQQCAQAAAASYVTEKALQHRYPPNPSSFTTHYSSVELPDTAFVHAPHVLLGVKPNYNLVTIAYLVDSRKGIDVLIDAIADCKSQNIDLTLSVVGDGKLRPILQAQAERLGLSNRVRFLGQLPKEEVRSQLDQADLFVLPSRGEGLPRALIEAMARGLPAIGSTVGGFPELLSTRYLVAPGKVGPLSAAIAEVVSDPQNMNKMACENLQRSREYHKKALGERRVAFYRYLQKKTEAWVAK